MSSDWKTVWQGSVGKMYRRIDVSPDGIVVVKDDRGNDDYSAVRVDRQGNVKKARGATPTAAWQGTRPSAA
jgi:hypothetical protein